MRSGGAVRAHHEPVCLGAGAYEIDDFARLVERTTDAADYLHAAEVAAAEGYSFPTNLDRDPPLYGLAPETQAALFRRALAEDWEPAAFTAALDEQAERREA